MTKPDPLNCEVDQCQYKTPENLNTLDLQIRHLELHFKSVHETSRNNANANATSNDASTRPDKLPRPSLEEGISEADWVWFEEQWKRYKRSTGLKGDNIVDHLWATATSDLAKRCYEAGNTDKITEDDLLKRMKKLAVRAQNNLVNIVEFLSMTQDTDEPAATYISRLRGQSKVCDFSVKCTNGECETNISYDDKMVAHQLVRGLEDLGMQEKVLAHAATHKDLDLNAISKFVEAQEMGARSSKILGGGANVSKLSDYQRQRSNTLPSKMKTLANDDEMKNQKCSYCGYSGHGRKPPASIRQNKCPAWGKECKSCHNIGHFAAICKTKNKQASANAVDGDDSNASLFGLTSPPTRPRHKKLGIRVLSHVAMNRFGKWEFQSPETQPSIAVSVTISDSSYDALSIPKPNKNLVEKAVAALPDSGAQVSVGGPDLIHALGITKNKLIPVSQRISAANNGQLPLLGGILLDISGKDAKGKTHTSSQLVYIADGIKKLLLSKSACVDLGILPQNFPMIGNDNEVANNMLNCVLDDDNHTVLVDECTADNEESTTCSCPKREETPPVPEKIPFEPKEENVPKLKQWILDYYKKSGFNCCKNQPLPLVNGTVPMSLYIDEKVKPVAFHKAYPVPIHWQEEVKKGLDDDVKLGVLEKVPVGEPTTWCSRMVTVSKKDGKPRRTVDLKHLNDAAKRQTNPVKAPFLQATAVPSDTYKTCLDAWNGFHSIPLKEEDRPLTTFVTPWGRYRYKCLPQGFLAATDGYTERYDYITRDIKNMERCVDDAILYENSIEENFFRTCQYLSLCSANGILFSEKKFQFCSKKVDFLGFILDEEGVKPSDEHLKAIQDFPTPRDITGIRSWFGLIEQSSYAFSKTDVMQPFRHLLKPSSKFEWNAELNNAFKDSKEEIVKRIVEGIKTFDTKKVTCLATDYSKTGIGFHLLQKNCKCNNLTPICCKDGWSIVFANSRFTNAAEYNYAPIEGELLAAVWAMKKCQYFILGCENFILATDHKPLLGVLGNRSLEEIENPRLQKLKEKTFRFRFSTIHVPGRRHKTADATSRQPVQQAETECLLIDGTTVTIDEYMEGLGQCVLSALNVQDDSTEVRSEHGTAETLTLEATVLTWENVKTASAEDDQIQKLVSLISNEETDNKDKWLAHAADFYPARTHLTCQDNVVFYKDRIVIPTSLRRTVLNILHSGHSGVSSMMLRAADSVWWPGLQTSLENTRQLCESCDKSAPSQPAAPPTPLPSPSYPFELICADYFAFMGNKYLVIDDRFSNWLSVTEIRNGQGAENLQNLLRQHFLTYGVSTELASDGGLEFTAASTQKFLKDWGVHHRLSSAYHPHSNQRAELAVKTAKRLIRENTDKSGNLNNDKFSRALLNYRNTPCRDIGLSPSQIIFGRKLRDFIPCRPGEYEPRAEWILTREQREKALSRRYEMMGQRLKFGTKTLKKLEVGNIVSVQNQTGPRAKKWDKTGVIVETLPYDQYRIKMDGSGQVTLRNRQFIRKLANGTSIDSNDSANAETQTQSLAKNEDADQATQPQVVCGHLSCGPEDQDQWTKVTSRGRRRRGVRDNAANPRLLHS